MAKTHKIEIPATMPIDLGYDAGTFEFDMTAMTPATILSVLGYGLRQVSNDGGPSATKELIEEVGEIAAKTAAVIARANAVQANEHAFGGGGGRLSPVVRVLREWLADDLSSADVCGGNRMKKTDAVKLVTADSDAGFAELCKRRGVENTEESWTQYQESAEEEAGRRASRTR